MNIQMYGNNDPQTVPSEKIVIHVAPFVPPPAQIATPAEDEANRVYQASVKEKERLEQEAMGGKKTPYALYAALAAGLYLAFK